MSTFGAPSLTKIEGFEHDTVFALSKVNKIMEVSNKPPCEFGARCYRKSQKHLDTYSHPNMIKRKCQVEKSEHFRHLLLFAFNQGSYAAKAARDICAVYGKNAICVRTAQEWYVKFKNGNFNLKDAPRPGRPVELDETLLNQLVRENPHQTTRELAEKMNASHTSIEKHLHLLGKQKSHRGWVQSLKKRRELSCQSVKNVPKWLEPDQSNTVSETEKSIKTKRKRKDFDKQNSLSVSKTKAKRNKRAKKTNDSEITIVSDEGSESDNKHPASSSWVFISTKSTENSSEKQKMVFDDADLKNKTVQELIKMLFLVDMPPDFYSFYEFYKSMAESHRLKNLQLAGLKLVGPFEILSGTLDYSIERELLLCHWRFYYDPPEFQTVLVTHSGLHFGYWRDDPKENPVFLASNDPNKGCIFKIEAENIFGCAFHYLKDTQNTDIFKKAKIAKLQSALRDWAEKNKFSLEKINTKINRQRKVIAKSFHGAGIVVPVEPKTKLGYRPLIETNANLKKICKLIMEAKDENEKEHSWEELQPLITAGNVANDECDFGNSLELGIDLFCMGSPVFHNTIEHILSTAYTLLHRIEFAKIIKAHLKFRRKGNNMSIYNLN